MSIVKLKNRFANGAWLTNVKEYFTKINELVDASNSSYTPSYKVYTALLTQTGTNAPVATVLENTIGDIVWTRFSAGRYRGTLIGAFTENKTISPQVISLGAQSIIVGTAGSKYDLSRKNADRMDVEIKNSSDAFIDWSDVSGNSFLVQIIVYN